MDETMHTRVDTEYLDELIRDKYDNNRENLIMILQDISGRYNYIPPGTLERVAKCLKLPLSKVYEVVTFYKAFSLEPRGKHVIDVCTGTACHVRGAERIKESLEQKLGIHEGETTGDLMFTLEMVRCLGCCALGPVITVDGVPYGGLDRSKSISIIDKYEEMEREP